MSVNYLIPVILILAFLGMPLFAVILSLALVGFYSSGIDLSVIGIEIFRLTNTPLLLALPLFTLAGYLLSHGNTSKRLVRLSRALLGWMPGELVIISLFACAFFTAFTGATGITIVAMGALLYPALKRDGYNKKFSLGLVTTSGSLGLLLPPSLPLIIYAVIVQQLDLEKTVTIKELFVAGLYPSLLMIFAIVMWSAWTNRNVVKPKIPFDLKEAIDALREAIWGLPLPFIVLGGIYGGIFAVSEAAAITALYILFVQVFIHKETKLKDLPEIAKESMLVVGGILLILGVSLALTNYLIDAEIPSQLFSWVKQHIHSPITFLLFLNIFLLVLGAILDIFSALVIMVPLIVPLAIGYGIDPVHLGVIFLANMQLGYFTPPVGMNLFIASFRFNRPITDIYKATIPFFFVLLAAVLIITYVPALSLSLIR
ncbi:MAG: TRAP transporter large permease subunit [Gammaproteobacteria bacterium]|nr:TRAP transporter large permease subunit [Gammaproteobacteria bacterium]MCW8986532.1 TRAP transporter large permease subunit [Gammaproteobacteria bacterium]MCW9031033.1 TRAP transporter large permease subunit [Gammaproteobacteria bacterium]